jgi:hypothetical protein
VLSNDGMRVREVVPSRLCPTRTQAVALLQKLEFAYPLYELGGNVVNSLAAKSFPILGGL